MPVRCVETYADNFGVLRRDFRASIPEALRFTGSTRGEVLREEVQDHMTAILEVAQAQLPSIRKRPREVRGTITGRKHTTSCL
jgi:hypothetical protein